MNCTTCKSGQKYWSALKTEQPVTYLAAMAFVYTGCTVCVTIFSTGGKLQLVSIKFYGVTCSYSSRPFLCALPQVYKVSLIRRWLPYRWWNVCKWLVITHVQLLTWYDMHMTPGSGWRLNTWYAGDGHFTSVLASKFDLIKHTDDQQYQCL